MAIDPTVMAASFPIKGEPVRIFGAGLRQADGLSDLAVDCRHANAVSVRVLVSGSPGATITIEGATAAADAQYQVLPDAQATQTAVNSTDIFDVSVGQAFVKVRLDGGTYTGDAGYVIEVTPYFAAGQSNLSVTNVASQNLSQVGGAAISLGQKTAASSLPVVLSSDVNTVTLGTGTATVGKLASNVGVNIGTVTTDRKDTTITVTIASGQSLSAEVDLGRYALVGIHMPAAWTAANLTFQAAKASGGTFNDVYDDDGNELVVTAAASRSIGVDTNAGVLAPFRFLKVRSGTSATPVNQAAQRTITLIVKG